MKYNSVLVTGCNGFIGGHFFKLIKEKYPNINIVGFDFCTYAATWEGEFDNVEVGDIASRLDLVDLFEKHHFDLVVNFAAESHVDNSIKLGDEFLRTNVLGVQNLLKLCNDYNVEKFVQISTDEVYGSLDIDFESSREEDNINCSSLYSASKASAEQLVFAFNKTFGQNYLITRSSNNFGSFQHDEKLIPKVIKSLCNNKPVKLYGDGTNIRDWVYVKDNVKAILSLIEKDVTNEVVNIGGGNETSNIDIVKLVAKCLNLTTFDIEFTDDRLGHDFRYSLNTSKLNSFGIEINSDFESSLVQCVNWYKERYK